MAYSKKLTTEANKARARRDSQNYRQKTNNISARVHNKAARLAAQWVQETYPQKWAALVRKAKSDQAANTTEYVPYPDKFGAGSSCDHGHVHAVGIMAKCDLCGEFVGTIPIETNQDLLQEILDAEY